MGGRGETTVGKGRMGRWPCPKRRGGKIWDGEGEGASASTMAQKKGGSSLGLAKGGKPPTWGERGG